MNLAEGFSLAKLSIIRFLCCFVNNKREMPGGIPEAHRCEEGKRLSPVAVECPLCFSLLLNLLQVLVLQTQWTDFKMEAKGLW